MHGSYFEYFISHDVETPVAKKCLVSLFIFVRGATDMLFKQSAEVLWILKSQFISHLADSLNTFQYSFFCQFDNPMQHIYIIDYQRPFILIGTTSVLTNTQNVGTNANRCISWYCIYVLYRLFSVLLWNVRYQIQCVE